MFRASRMSVFRPAARSLPLLAVIAGIALTGTPIEGRGGPEGRHPQLGATVDLPDEVFTVGLDGNLAYVVRSWWFVAGWGVFQGSQLSTYDLSSPAPQAPLGSLEFSAGYRALAADGGLLYLAGFGLATVDVSDPANPHTVGTLAWPERLACIAAAGGCVYVGDTAGLHVIDVTDPAFPSLLGSVGLSSKVVSVALRGTLAFVGTLDANVAVVDVSNPLLPVVVSTLALPGTPWDIAVRGSHAYVSDGESGLQILDISRPGKPRLAGGVDTPGDAHRIAVSGARAYVVDRRIRESFPAGVTVSDLLVIDISNPRFPVIVNSIAGTDQAGDVGYWDTSEDRSIVAGMGRVAVGRSILHSWLGDCIATLGSCDEHSGLLIVTPRLALESPSPWSPSGASSAAEGVPVADPLPPTAFARHANDPNPFNSETSIHFDVARVSPVRVRIFDTQGRLVSTLVDRALPPGPHTVLWRGQSESGQRVSSGIYLLVLEAEDARQTRKITLLR